jgi:hypothetical protein
MNDVTKNLNIHDKLLVWYKKKKTNPLDQKNL